MDYDDNDFQSQNFQLDDSKFPPSLQSLALPKFDLDEHLQVHLRFDSLVDSEVLLGIQGQDSNWIQDFSSGTSAIEFSPSAAENCSISRRNVWSEATSSESVEMLLRSVGEDDMSDKKAFAMEADAQNGAHGSINQTGQVSEQFADVKSTMGDIAQNDPSIPPDKFQGPVLGQDKDESRIQLQVEGTPKFFSSEISSSELSASSLENKSQSDVKIGSGKYTTDEDTTLPEDGNSGNCITASETSSKVNRNVTSVDVQFMKGSDAGICEESEGTRGSTDSITCRSNQDGHSSVSKLVMDSGSFIDKVRLEHVAEELTMVSVTERPDLLSGDAHREEIKMSGEGQGHEHFVGVHEAKSDFLTGNGSSFLEPAKDSMMLMTEGCSFSGFSGSSDGLLELIACQAKAFDNDSEGPVRCSVQENEMNSREIQSPGCIITKSVEIRNEFNDRNEEGIPEMEKKEVNVSVDKDFKTQLEGGTKSNHSNFGSQSGEPTVGQKSLEAVVVEDVKIADSQLFASENLMLGESPLHDLAHTPEVKLSSPLPSKSLEAAESSDIHPSLEVSAGEDIECPGTTNICNEGSDVGEKAEETPSAGKVVNVCGTSVFTTTVSAEDASDVKVLSPKKSEDIHLADPGNSCFAEKVIEQKEAASPKAPVPDNINSDAQEIEKSAPSTIPKANIMVRLPIKPLLTSDAIAANFSPSRGRDQDAQEDAKVVSLHEIVEFDQPQDSSAAVAVAELKEGAKLGPVFSDFVQSVESRSKDSMDYIVTKSEVNVVVQVSGKSLAQPDNVKDSPLNSRKEPQVVNLVRSASLGDKPSTVGQDTIIEGNPTKDETAMEEKEDSDKTDTSAHEDKKTPLSHSETSTSLPRNRTDDNLLEIESGIQSLPEPSCGSPTVISCSQRPTDHSKGGDVDKVDSTLLQSMVTAASEGDKSFTFEVGEVHNLPGKGIDKWRPFSNVHSPEPSKILKDNFEGCHLESEREKDEIISKADCESKASNEDTTGHITGSSSEKLTAVKGKPAKGASTRKKSRTTRKSCSTSSTPVRSSDAMVESKQYTCTESSPLKASGSSVIQIASLPDLNSSTTVFHQPFTDPQQVQLRAQIFVYGSLIQGIPPDEACMQSAFGEADCGRSSWESLWRALVEKHLSQKSPFNSETPLRTHSAVRVPEKVAKCSSLQSRAASTSSSRSSGKVLPSPIPTSTPPLPSPLWSTNAHDGLHSNLPRGTQLDFSQGLSPLHPYPPSQTRQYASSKPPWLPQNLRPGPWAVSAHSPMLSASSQYKTIPVIETVHVTPGRESSIPRAASAQLVSPSSILPAHSPSSIAPASAVQLDMQKKTASPRGNKTASSVQKSRKRKKAAGTEDPAHTLPISQSNSEPASSTVFSLTASSTPSPVSLTAKTTGLPLYANFPSKISPEATTVVTSINMSPVHYQIAGSGNTEQRVIFSEETGNKIEQAKLQAEEAASLAASVVAQSQGMWKKLASENQSGLATEVEEKLASAAVATAAAAAVAKAAAAAAKIASDAAIQAKMMADEAMYSTKPMNLQQTSETIVDAGKNFASLSTGSILKGKDNTHGSSSIISTAREATRRRVEAASAAAKRAENLDAIMRAAELAAEAVYQVGMIVTMGDPLPFKLSELIEAGPDGYWKVDRSPSAIFSKVDQLHVKQKVDLDIREVHCEQTPFNDKETHITAKGAGENEQSIQSKDKQPGTESGLEDELIISRDLHDNDNSSGILKENAIQKGSFVEVISDEEGLKGGWFSARIVDVKDNKACVCYNNLLSDDGSGQLKEWVSLDNETNGAPRIRVAHPMTAIKSDGTKKRRREVGNYAWEIGDRVDAWMRDGWWEGVIIDKSLVDDTKLTVQFPAGGDSSVVRAWDLRPSLTWKDGQWVEFSRATEDKRQPYEGDTPQQKRQKLAHSETKIDVEKDVSATDKLSKKIPPHDDSKKTEDLRPLNLSAKDKVFSLGKNENIPDALKGKRTGPQKEESRVVFGVPKPGKKRKFMEVSKHYVSDKSDRAAGQGNDSIKFAKYLMPQASQSRPWRNTTKVDSKRKRAGDSKPVVGVNKSVKSQAGQARKVMEKDNPSFSTVSASNGRNNSRGASPSVGSGFSNEEGNPEKNSVEAVSFPRSLAATGSLVQPPPALPSSRKKSSSAADVGPGVRGRPPTVSDRSEDPGKATAGATEPRRSSRKIQPTSRLLEGLQTSLIISKIPSFSHDKSSRGSHKGSSSTGNPRG